MADDKATQALLEELKASREQGAATLAILAQLVESFRPKPEADVAQAMAERMEQIRGKPSLKLVTVHANCTSPDTGATFDVVIENGEVSRLLGYKEPESAYLSPSQGGFWAGDIYDGKEVGRDGKPRRNQRFCQELYTRFYLADATRYVGKPCPAYLSATSKPAPKEAAASAKTG